MRYMILVLPEDKLVSVVESLRNRLAKTGWELSVTLRDALERYSEYSATFDPPEGARYESRNSFGVSDHRRPVALFKLLAADYPFQPVPPRNKVLITVSGGVVDDVTCSQPASVWIKDWDNIKAGSQFDPDDPDYDYYNRGLTDAEFRKVQLADLEPHQLAGYVEPEPPQEAPSLPYRRGSYWLRLREDGEDEMGRRKVSPDAPWSRWYMADCDGSIDEDDLGWFSTRSEINIDVSANDVRQHPELYEVRRCEEPTD